MPLSKHEVWQNSDRSHLSNADLVSGVVVHRNGLNRSFAVLVDESAIPV